MENESEKSRMACSTVISREHTLRKDYIQFNNSSKALREMSVKAWLKSGKNLTIADHRDIIRDRLQEDREEYREDNMDNKELKTLY